jgi:hypothetical protein
MYNTFSRIIDFEIIKRNKFFALSYRKSRTVRLMSKFYIGGSSQVYRRSCPSVCYLMSASKSLETSISFSIQYARIVVVLKAPSFLI